MRTWLLCALTLVGCSGGFSTEPAEEQQDVEDSTGGARESGGDSGSGASGGQEDPTGGNATGGDAPEPPTGGVVASGGQMATGGESAQGSGGEADSCPGSYPPHGELDECEDCSIWSLWEVHSVYPCRADGEYVAFCKDRVEEQYCCCPPMEDSP